MSSATTTPRSAAVRTDRQITASPATYVMLPQVEALAEAGLPVVGISG
jgi:hypothetical protein